MNKYFYESECESSPLREQALLRRLADFINYAKQECEHYKETLAHIDGEKITSRELLAQLPITRKSDLIRLQAKQSPLGGLNAAKANLGRIFQSPGPIYDPENTKDDWWRMGQAFYAAGFRQGELVQNCLSYHLTPGGFILDSGARACGCIVIPAGPGQTDQQLDIIEHLKPQGYAGTPSFLKILLDKAKAENRDVSSITKALVTGEALPKPLRAELAAAGIDTLQAYATADVGLIGFESQSDEGLIIAEDLLVEIVRPGSLEPVAEGEVGEVVVTSFNVDYPLIRFATGDLSAVKLGVSDCGRTNMRIKGWLGRADQTTKVKGMFVHASQIEQVRQAYPYIAKMRLVVSQANYNDKMHLQCEVTDNKYLKEDVTNMLDRISSTLKKVTKLTGTIEFVALGSLADDGKVIDDLRTID
ncbi:AMP-binding protein [Colwellia sp. 1_MG-2023]|uniref:phenylacetate--CoA ligase family protein n=1 Tax=unclassified Colwellia TaxID=196834 RepID=UPI001C08F69A|nr:MULTISPECIES: AMP-binding protein [unclassified Colwellia]MBU2926560.1 AMP-binding protein [Colwellia sp. C2M11]MDO6487519.1 AMP-binding protein [Colwellia sp. 6_MG-2023]MDO6652598.1 AMP-binding protein [Colwellia sp. 3_MG-2023]MDO6665199.1 AMP-binding protein [Colwellia sp. 2_MG-2023]MDO6689479.1 AMP-binding protein [Colwellia sp. 1_MG-2023]